VDIKDRKKLLAIAIRPTQMTLKENPKVNWSDKILSECIGEEPPPCQAACPLNIRVREKLRFMQQGNLSEALAVVLERCPFPGILGRI
jgi:NADPH-dependent glutamate synthase beta subunit-like oxidoreductase